MGFHDSTAVSVVSGEDLSLLYRVDTRAADNGDLASVAWSADGERLYAAGRNDLGDGQNPVRAWSRQGRGAMQTWPVSTNTVSDLQPLADGRLVFAAGDPAWGVLDARGQRLVQQTPPILDHRGNFETFRLSAAGDVVEFQQKTWRDGRWQTTLARFDLASRRLEHEVSPLAGLHAPSTRGLAVTDWKNTTHPRLAGPPLALSDQYETSFSLAVSPDARRFALGTGWHVYLFDHQGRVLWRKSTPGVAWLVNLSTDGRYVVAALGDGSLRWYRTDDKGSEALAFFVHADGERWVLWTPEGFYDASPGADDLFGYHLNQGRDQGGELVVSGRLSKAFYRPDLIARRLAGDEAAITAAVRAVGDVRQVLTAGLRPELRLLSAATAESEGEYELKLDIKARSGGVGEVEIRINDKKLEGRTSPPTGGMMSQRLFLAPGRNVIAAEVNDRANKQVSEPVQAVVIVRPPIGKPTLHVLAIGVSDYEDAAFATEGIRYAAQDARDFAAKLQQRGQGMYETIDAVVLTKPEEVKLTRIEEALRALAQRYRPQDVAVIYLAGHGRAVDGKYHFIPGDLIFENEDSLRGHALTQAKLEEHLKVLGAGKQLLVIDTCHAGAMTQIRAGQDERFAIANLMKMTGSAILAATLPDQLAVQDKFKGHGVFTGSLLEGLDGPADFNHSGFVDVDELASYAVKVVPDRAASIKDGVPQGAKQRPMRQTTGEPFDVARIPEIP